MLDTKATAARLGVDEKTVFNLWKRGLLPKAIPQLKRPLLFDEAAVEDLLHNYLDTPKWRPHGRHKWDSKRRRAEAR